MEHLFIQDLNNTMLIIKKIQMTTGDGWIIMIIKDLVANPTIMMNGPANQWCRNYHLIGIDILK